MDTVGNASMPTFRFNYSKQARTIIRSAEYNLYTNDNNNNEVHYKYVGNEEIAPKTIQIIGLFEKYSTEKSPEITQKELWEITDFIYSTNKEELNIPKYDNDRTGGLTESGTAIYNFEKAAEHYTSEYSPSGDVIDINELYNMTDLLLLWAGFTKEE